MNRQDIEQFALSLPNATQEPHFHFTSFRIDGRIFATMPPSKEIVHIFVPEEQRMLAVAQFPEACEVLNWGSKLVGIKVEFEHVSDELVRELLTAAHEAKSAQ